MTPHKHLLLAFLGGIATKRVTASRNTGLLHGLIGFFLDLDHFVDFFISKPTSIIDFGDFFSGDFSKRMGKSYLFLHSFELLPLIGILAAIGVLKPKTAFALISAIGIHLLADQMDNQVKRGAYFFCYRWFHGFDLRFIELAPSSEL